MTAADSEPLTTDDLGDIAEDLLGRAATVALALSNEPTDPETGALIAQVYVFEGLGEPVPVTLAELRAAGATREYTLRPRPGDG